ncbi:MAG: transcription termination factor Rho [Atopobiaceae bacterium]|jgi:transcription termination factor Rho|nr:transcription termination factor Rho [Atopobiaceae bacterium]
MAENTENIDENPVEDASAPVVDEAQGDKRHRDEPNREEEPGEQQGQRGDAVTQQPEGDAEASDSGEGSEPSDESVSDDAQGDQGDSGQQRGKRRRQGNQANNNGQARGKASGGRNQNNANRRRNRRNGQSDPMPEPSVKREDLEKLKVAELRAKAAELEIDYAGMRKATLIDAVYHAAAMAEGFKSVSGILDIQNEGYGFLRTGNYMKGDGDAFVHQQLIRQYALRTGDKLVGTLSPARTGNKYPPLGKIESINDRAPEEIRNRPRFRDLTPIYPDERLLMEHGKDSITGRAIDLVAPIGKGQRGLIVSPPKAGKTTVLKRICQSIAANNPEVHLFCLLVDERPEEVTDMERSVRGEVVASTFDMPSENHTAVSELVIERAKRLVELGEDVVVVLDSITRLARAYNLAQPASGRILSGGVDSAALYPPKRFLGAARNIEGGGSLTILASALVDTGSKMDEVIFEEFKGTGNMELKLDRDLADKRIFPAIDPVSSGTRNEELLIETDLQPFVWGIRRVLANMNNIERAESALVKGLKQTSDNKEFLIRWAKKAQMEYA